MSIGDHKLEKNAIILVVTEVLVKALGLGLTIAVARMLGVEKFGLLAFAYALSGIFLVLPRFGFDQLTVRELARRPSRASRFLVNISAVKGLLYLPMAGFCALMALQGPHAEGRLFVVLVVFLVAAAQQHLLFSCSFFRAIEKMEREALVRLILAVLSLVTGLAVLLAGFEIKALVVSRLAVSLLCLGLAILFIKKDLGVSLEKVSWRYAKRLVKMSAPLAIFFILVMVYGSLNMVILGFIKGDIATGYYSAAYTLFMLFFVVPGAVAGASLPALSKYWKESHQAFVQTYQKSVRYLLLLGIPLAVGAFLLGEKAIILFFGIEYLPSVAVIKVLVLALVPDFLNSIMAPTLISMNRERSVVIAGIIGAVLALGSSLILIPRWAAVGAAASLFITVCAVFCFQFFVLLRQMPIIGPLRTAARAALAAGLMAVGLVWLTKANTALPLQVGFSALLYTGCLLALGEVRTQEVKKAWKVLRELGKSIFARDLAQEGQKRSIPPREDTYYDG